MSRKDEANPSESLDPRALADWVASLGEQASLLPAVLSSLRHTLGMARARLLRVDPRGRLRLVLQAPNPEAEEEMKKSRSVDRLFEGIVLRRGRSLSINNAATHRRWRSHPAHLEDGVTSFVGVPIRAHGHPWAILSVTDGAARELTPRVAHALSRIAETLGGMVEHAADLTPLEQQLPGAFEIRDDFGRLLGEGNTASPDISLDPGQLAERCFQSAWAGGEPAQEVPTSFGAKRILYGRRFGTVGDWTQPDLPEPAKLSDAPARRGTLLLIQAPGLSRDATADMLAYLGFQVKTLEPGEVMGNGVVPKDSIVVLATEGRARESLERRLEGADQRLLIVTDDLGSEGATGRGFLRRPFSLTELAASLQALDG